MKVYGYMLILVLVAGCSSKPVTKEEQSASAAAAVVAGSPDMVLARIDNMKERPAWLKESVPFEVSDGFVTFLGRATLDGDKRIESGYRIADNNAKALVAGTIQQRLEFILQNAEEGTGDNTQTRYIGAEASKLVTSSIQLYKRYWERSLVTTDSGEKKTRIEIFSLMRMPELDFKKSILEAANQNQGKENLTESFSKKVENQWDSFVGSERNPAQQPEK